MPLKIVRNDITKMQVDAIVNTANSMPGYGNGVDSAVYHAAGEKELLEKRREIGTLQEGDVAITPGFRLPAKYIIHAVSPLYIDGNSGEEKLLRGCYRKSLVLADELHCSSIAFPLIATGGYGYPKEEGFRIALDEINTFLCEHSIMVYLVVFDSKAVGIGSRIFPDLEQYIDSHYVEEKRREEYGSLREDSRMGRAEIPRPVRSERSRMPLPGAAGSDVLNRRRIQDEQTSGKRKAAFWKNNSRTAPSDEYDTIPEEKETEWNSYDAFLEKKETELESRIEHLSDTFQQYLLYLIQVKGLTNAQVYKRAIVTKQVFSKIKINVDYHPDKATAMRLCVGAGLNLDETRDLLARAGYALSPCDKRDVIFSYFIENQIYDMIDIDIALEEYGLPCFI